MSKKAYKFILSPNKTHTAILAQTFGNVRFVWNTWTTIFNSPKLSDPSTNKSILKIYPTTTQLRNLHPFLQLSSAATLQQKYRDFIQFQKQYFNKSRKKKLGKPKFKKRKDHQSFRLPAQKFKLDQINSKIYLEKIGWIHYHKSNLLIPETSELISATVSKDKCDTYYASVLVEESIPHKPKTRKSVGIDVGISHFCTLSNGIKIENPKYFRESQSKIKKVQRSLSRKIKGSKRYNKNKLKLSKLHRKVKRRRDLFQHTVSLKLVNEFDNIYLETLNLQGMMKNHKLAGAIGDVGWYDFMRKVEYKGEWYGKCVKRIGRFEPSSKRCSFCGTVRERMGLGEREWVCEFCEFKHDRDVNAAINILEYGNKLK